MEKKVEKRRLSAPYTTDQRLSIYARVIIDLEDLLADSVHCLALLALDRDDTGEVQHEIELLIALIIDAKQASQS